ncbi:MAG: hypothetical protein V3T23_13410 [Nitrososphaerales archaeon]
MVPDILHRLRLHSGDVAPSYLLLSSVFIPKLPIEALHIGVPLAATRTLKKLEKRGEK